MVCGGVLEDGLVMGLSLLLEGPEIKGSFCSNSLSMGYLDAQMVLERVLYFCVWGKYGVCCGIMFSIVLRSYGCKV